jgi:acyl carrier protein
MNEVLSILNTIFCDVVDEEDVILELETTALDVEDWDSLNHIQFVVAIEKHFHIKFTSSEISEWENVGEMCSAISKKIV